MSAPVQPGDILAGKYRIESVLGVGGMGVVVTATHVAFDDKVAIKFLLPHAAQNGEVVARFLREGRAARKITSEHGVKVTDVGTLESGAPYMVMEYLDGYDLAHHVKARGALPLEEALEYFLQALEAIAEAHAQGIVHRDLKPANLFLTRRRDGSPCVKVLDFGISKMATATGSEPDGALTRTNGMMGTALYMPPEQLQSAKDVDGRADIWALGVILYELLTANFPFLADDLPRLCMKVMLEPPTPLASYRPDLPPTIAQIIERCLQKDRNARFANVGELALALEAFSPQSARTSVQRIVRTMNIPHVAPLERPMVASAASQPMGTTAGGAMDVPTRTPKKSAAPIIAIVAVTFVLFAVGGLFGVRALRGESDKAPGSDKASAEKASTKIDDVELAGKTPEKKPAPAPTVAEVVEPPAVASAIPSATTTTTTATATATVATTAKAAIKPAMTTTTKATAKPTAAPTKPPATKSDNPFEGKF